MAKRRILLADPDPRSARVIEVSLKKAGYNVTSVEDGERLLEASEHEMPDLLICDVKLPKIDGYTLLRKLRERSTWAQVSTIFLVGQKSLEDKIRGLELGVEEYLTKPVFVRELLGRVEMLMARLDHDSLSDQRAMEVTNSAMSGSIRDTPVVDLLQSFDSSKRTGALKLSLGDRRATIWFVEGQVVDAEVGSLEGEEAVYRLFAIADGRYDIVLGAAARDRIVSIPTATLVMEGLRRADEWERLVEQLPPLTTLVEVNHARLLDRLSEIPDELNGILRLLDGTRTLMSVIDSSPFDDLSTLGTLAKLYFEGLFVTKQDAVASEAKPEVKPEAKPEIVRGEKGRTIPAAAMLASVETAGTPLAAIVTTKEIATAKEPRAPDGGAVKLAPQPVVPSSNRPLPNPPVPRSGFPAIPRLGAAAKVSSSQPQGAMRTLRPDSSGSMPLAEVASSETTFVAEPVAPEPPSLADEPTSEPKYAVAPPSSGTEEVPSFKVRAEVDTTNGIETANGVSSAQQPVTSEPFIEAPSLHALPIAAAPSPDPDDVSTAPPPPDEPAKAEAPAEAPEEAAVVAEASSLPSNSPVLFAKETPSMDWVPEPAPSSRRRSSIPNREEDAPRSLRPNSRRAGPKRYDGRALVLMIVLLTVGGSLVAVAARKAYRGSHDTAEGLALKPPPSAISATASAPVPVPSVSVAIQGSSTATPSATASAPATVAHAGTTARPPDRHSAHTAEPHPPDPRPTQPSGSSSASAESFTQAAQAALENGSQKAATRAIDLASRATQRDPSNAEAWLTLGAAYQALGAKSRALDAYRKCVQKASGPRVAECRALAGMD